MKKSLFISITALGISSVITQILLMREFLSVFSGNELVLGIVLANWLLITGIGSYLGKHSDKIKHKMRVLILSQLIISVLPVIQLFVIRAIKNSLFVPGAMIGVLQIVALSFLLLLPYCLISGFLLTLACVILSPKQEPKQIGMVYFIDNIGDIIGGAMFSFLLVFIFNPFQSAIILMTLNILAAFILTKSIKQKMFYPVILLAVCLGFVLNLAPLDKISTQIMYPSQELLLSKSTQYGNIVVTKQLDQINFYENGLPLFSAQNTITNEETVHYAMSQHPDAKSVLLISGGVAGTIDELQKYTVEIDYVELDPGIIQAAKQFTSLGNANIIVGDGRLYVKQTKKTYDAVIIDLPDPSTAQLNRFYTLEFFKEIKKILNNQGIVSLSLSSQGNYYSKPSKMLNSAVYQTLKNLFENVLIIPGQSNYYIASDSPLENDIVAKLESKNIQTQYVKTEYLSGILTQDRLQSVQDSVRQKVALNTDFKPVSYFYQLQLWLSQFGVNLVILFIIFAAVVLIYLSKLKPVPLAIFTTGFAGAGLEVVLLIGFQILYGYVYQMVGIIITAFMLGLAIGSYYMNRAHQSKNTMITVEILIFIYSMSLPLLLLILEKSQIMSWILFPFVTVILAVLVGMEFPLAAKLSFKGVAKTAASLYNADLIGACVGALVVSALLIPLLGIIKVCIIVGLLNLATAIVLWKT